MCFSGSRDDNAKLKSNPLENHKKLLNEQSPKAIKERENMTNVPYASAYESLMYAMVYTRPDITHVVGVVSRYKSNRGKIIENL